MASCEEQVLAETESVCPECLARVQARRVLRGDDVYLCKTCPQHGDFATVIWRGLPAITSWVRPKAPSHPERPFHAVERGCPFDCGLCAEHRQDSCCVLFELTERCDLRCPVCFADAGRRPSADPDLTEIEGWYRRLLEAGGPYNIQLSGGEPTLRDDLPEIIRLGRSLGYTFFQLNTNGRRLARDREYLTRLADAGLSTVFLQFDGVEEGAHAALRGRPLLAEKLAVIENCDREQVGVVLVPTLVPGVNTGQIGAIIDLALEHCPTVRGVHFQPISYFGRYPQQPADDSRITIPEIMRAVEVQTGGRIRVDSFVPPGGENALCSFHANFVLMPDGELKPLTRHKPVTPGEGADQPLAATSSGSCCGPKLPPNPRRTSPVDLQPGAAGPATSPPPPPAAAAGAAQSREFVARRWTAQQGPQPATGGPSLGAWDVFLERLRTHTFCVSGMAFQDAWNLDLERLRDCYIHNLSGDGQVIPFCAYNLTDSSGLALYRGRAAVTR